MAMSTGEGKTVDLYAFLKVAKDANATQIKKAYHALALKVHPDKNPNDPKAEENFKSLQKAYNILKDPAKRERYDRTGCSDEESEAFWDAYEKYRGIKISEKDIEEFQKAFKGSKDEERDLVTFFNTHSGDISNILGSIIGSTNEDVPRYVKFFESLLGDSSDNRLTAEFKDAFNKSKGTVRTLEELDAIDEEDVNDDDEVGSNEGDDDEGDAEMDDFIAAEDEDEEAGDSDENVEPMLFKVGEKVLARWRNGRKYYAGVVIKVNTDNTFDIKYTRDKVVEENVQGHLVKIDPNPVQEETPAEKEQEIEAPQEPKRKRAKRAKKKTTGDEEYGDLDALRAAMLGKGRAQARADNFSAFEKRWAGK